MSSAEREGPAADPQESADRKKGEPPIEGGKNDSTDSKETTLVSSPPSKMEKIGGDSKGDAAEQVDEDAETKVMSDEERAKAEKAGETEADRSADDTVVDPRGEAEAATTGIRIRYYGRTDVGLIREHNEDNFLVADLDKGLRDIPDDEVRRTKLGERGAIFAVCDGMGGAAAGEVASQMAVDTVYEFFSHVERAPKDHDQFARRLVAAIEEAGNRIFSAAKMDRTRRGMGTTATVAGLVDKVLFVGQVGDSRAYILRGDELGLITKDQSLVNQLIEAGQLTDEEAEAFEHSNIILQALGTTEDVTVDLTFLELRRGDRLMMCSDGLSGLVHAEMMKDVLQTTSDLSLAAEKLIEMANAGGGHDNITVVCAEFTGDDLAPPKESDHVAYQQYPLPVAEDEDRVSLPPRDTHIKEGGRKPGSDVKTRDEAAVHALTASQADEPVRPFSWGLIVLVLLLAVVAAAVAVAMGGRETVDAAGEPSERTRTVVAREGRTDEEEPIVEEGRDEVIEVRVVSDVTGKLWIDGVEYGDLEGEDVYVELVPGAHRFEAISDGNVVTSAIIQLRPGVPADVALSMPTGVDEPDPGEQPSEDVARVRDQTPRDTTTQMAQTQMTQTQMVTETETPPTGGETEMTEQGAGTGATTGETGTSTTMTTTTTTSMTTTEPTRMTTTMMAEEPGPPANPFE